MQRVGAFLLRRGPLGGDGLLAVAATVSMELELALSDHIQGPRALNAISAVVLGLPLAWRRTRPALVGPFVGVWIGFQALLNGDVTENAMTPIITVPLAVYPLGALCSRRAAVNGLIVALGGAYVDVFAEGKEVGASLIFVSLLIGGPWLVGRIVNARTALALELRDKARRLETEKSKEAELAVAEERARIARELHDVVAHSVSVMVVQAAAARRQLERDPTKARTALTSVETTGREALRDMRRMLGMLRKGDEDLALAPQPGIDQLDALVQRARDAGVDVEVHVEGNRRRLQSSVDLSAFRIIQEALTNTIKHAGPAHARVTVRYGDNDVELDVRDDGHGLMRTNGNHPAGGGHGLLGMRERVTVLGGELSAGHLESGGFGVHARLPLTPSEG